MKKYEEANAPLMAICSCCFREMDEGEKVFVDEEKEFICQDCKEA